MNTVYYYIRIKNSINGVFLSNLEGEKFIVDALLYYEIYLFSFSMQMRRLSSQCGISMS